MTASGLNTVWKKKLKIELHLHQQAILTLNVDSVRMCDIIEMFLIDTTQL